MSKCEFIRKILIYLGHIVGEGQLRIDPAKVEAVMNWPSPTYVIETRSFLGVVQYYESLLLTFLTWLLHFIQLQERVMDFSGEENNNMHLIYLKTKSVMLQ